MIEIGNKSYIIREDLIALGVSSNTIKSARLENAKGWKFIDHDGDVYIEYNSLREKYKKLIANAPSQENIKHQQILRQLVEKDPAALNFYRTYKIDAYRTLPDKAIIEYTRAAEFLNMLRMFYPCSKTFLKAQGFKHKDEVKRAAIAIIKADKIDIAPSRLEEAIRIYKEEGYGSRVHKGYANANSQKITEEGGEWLCAYYGNPFPKATVAQAWMAYNSMAKAKGWPELDHENTVYQYLHRPDVYQRWYGLREGWHKAKEAFMPQLRLQRASMRDALWFADGTGLNFVASDSNMQRIYWVNDDYSEVILGWDIDISEREQSVYRAFKAAVNFSGQKPYEIRYDQSKTHVKIGPFLDNIAAKLHFKTEAYNGKSKSIESITGRFQQQIMRQWFFFSGMNRDTRSERSKMNREAYTEIAQLTPDFATIRLVIEACVKEWNAAPHPKTGIPRMEMYLASHNPKAVPFSAVDAVEAFWNTAPRPITYNAQGLLIVVNSTKYLFEVYDGDMPDMEFRRKHIGAQFIVRYDPDDMSQAWLYEQTERGLAFVAAADNKEAHAAHVATQDHTEGERAQIALFQRIRREAQKEYKAEARAMAEKYELLPIQVASRQAEKIKKLSMADIYREDDNYQPRLVGGQAVSLYGNNSKDINEMEDAE